MYDVAVIGAGPGGYIAAIRAAQLGLKTVCIEKDQTLGGTCLNVGCIPSKALLQSSHSYRWMKEQSLEQGIECQNVTFDFSKMMARKEEIVKGLTQGVSSLFKMHKVESLVGTAKIVNPQLIEVSTKDGIQKVEVKNIILATGSEPIPLPFIPFDEENVLSSTGALRLKAVPKKMVVIGGGVIGVELASVYNRLGTEVIIVEMLDQICIAMDEQVSKALLQTLKKQGIQFHLSAKLTSAEKTAQGFKLQVEQQGKTFSLDADKVLVAVGRRPYIQGLNLELLGIKLNKNMVVVDRHFRSSIPNIYAIGDLIEGPMLAHKASDEGYAVAEILAGQQGAVNYMAIPNIIYTHPEAAAVGFTEKEAQSAGLEVFVGQAFFKANGRARCSGETEGFVKVIGAGKKKTLVGMHIFGPEASDLIHSGMLAIEKKMTLEELALAPFGHPTLSETIKEACHAPRLKK